MPLSAWKEKLENVAERGIANYVEARSIRTLDQCGVLSQLDQSRMDDPTVTSADIFYAGISPRFDTDEAGALASYVRAVEPKLDIIEGWDEDDMVVFYRAKLGMPLYFFQRVTGELHRRHRKVQESQSRGLIPCISTGAGRTASLTSTPWKSSAPKKNVKLRRKPQKRKMPWPTSEPLHGPAPWPYRAWRGPNLSLEARHHRKGLSHGPRTSLQSIFRPRSRPPW